MWRFAYVKVMNLFIASLAPLLALSAFIVFECCMANQLEDSEDYVPSFFGGRRNEFGNSGMDPPHQAHPKSRSGGVVQTMNFTQKLDHFNKCDKRVWSQRYQVHDANFQPRAGGPIFIRIGGENEISKEDLEDGPIIRLAEEHRALVLSLEHRFYGESKPRPNVRTKNLRYLSSQQALADLEAFIKATKTEYEQSNPNAKVVLFGCSYAGSLAAYHRRLYPNSTAGAVAGFAPIFAVAEFGDYLNGMWQVIEDESKECAYETRKALMHAMCLVMKFRCDEYVAFNADERDKILNDTVELCEPKKINYTNPRAVASVGTNLVERLMDMAQSNTKYSDGTSDIKILCRYMLNMNDRALTRYAAWRKEVDQSCIIHHGKAIQALGTDWATHSEQIRVGDPHQIVVL